MVVNFLMFLLIVGLIYIFAYPDSQLAETTSAIGQIWSGSCRLSCRQSEYSGYSGLSGLVPGNSQDNKGFFVGCTSYQGPSSCVCGSCPCALIENVLRTCRPATSMYSSAVQFVATVYYSVLETLSEIYNYVEGVLNCRASCQRPQAQLLRKDSASDTIYFGKNKHKDSVDKTKDKSKTSDAGMRKSRSIVFRDVSDTIPEKRDEGSNKTVRSGFSGNVSNATLKPKEEEDGKSMVSAESSCPKCVKQGKVCMKSCPNAAKKK